MIKSTSQTYGSNGWLVHRVLSHFSLSATVYIILLSKVWSTFIFYCLLYAILSILVHSSIYPASTNLISTYTCDDSLVRSILFRNNCAITIMPVSIPTLFPRVYRIRPDVERKAQGWLGRWKCEETLCPLQKAAPTTRIYRISLWMVQFWSCELWWISFLSKALTRLLDTW